MYPIAHWPSGTVSWAQIPGTRHRETRQSCQDVIFLSATPDCFFCGLADGQSGTRYGSDGGTACLEVLFQHIASVGIGSLLDAPFPDELPCTLTQVYRRRLLELSAILGEPLREFASTLLAIAIEPKTGRFLLLHLGDGCAISVPNQGEPVILSAPDNGFSCRDTWLTTSQNAVSHLHIRFGSTEGKSRILLLSDGASCLCRGRNIPRRAKELLKSGDQPELQDALEHSQPTDDATCILLTCDTPHDTAAAAYA